METVTFELKSTSDAGSGTFEGIMSAPVLDRDNEIIDTLAFAPLPEHITIDIDHGLTVEKTVGSGTPFYDENGILKVKGSFASTPLGQVTRTLVKEGHIRHMSVAFRGAVRELDEKTGITHIRKGDLINCTITGIPANTATAVVAKVGARNSMKDAERIQTMHDYAIELGAQCSEKHAHGVVAYGNTVVPAAKSWEELAKPISRDGFVEFAAGTWTFTEPLRITGENLRALGTSGMTKHAADTSSTETETPDTAASAAVSGAQVDVARALATLAAARATLVLD